MTQPLGHGIFATTHKTEADRLGIPYQTLIGSLLHRDVHGELVDKKAIELAKELKTA